MPDEVDQVLGDGVHVGGVVLQGGGGGEGRREVTAQRVPLLSVLIDHPDVIVVLGPQLSVDHISFVGRPQWVLGNCSENVDDVLQWIGQSQAIIACYQPYLAIKQVDQRVFPDDILSHHRAEQSQLLLVGLVVFVVAVFPDDLHVHPLGSYYWEGERSWDLSQNLNKYSKT